MIDIFDPDTRNKSHCPRDFLDKSLGFRIGHSKKNTGKHSCHHSYFKRFFLTVVHSLGSHHPEIWYRLLRPIGQKPEKFASGKFKACAFRFSESIFNR